jgi:hypothetical protein
VGEKPAGNTGPEGGKKKATILVRRVSTVMASAAISSSRTAFNAFPRVERTKLLMIQTHR